MRPYFFQRTQASRALANHSGNVISRARRWSRPSHKPWGFKRRLLSKYFTASGIAACSPNLQTETSKLNARASSQPGLSCNYRASATKQASLQIAPGTAVDLSKCTWDLRRLLARRLCFCSLQPAALDLPAGILARHQT